ncbi:MAG: glycosyltransferase, partial [Caldilineaceae bacterium]
MRILHVIHGLPPEKLGGAEVYTRNVASAQAAAGHQVAIFTASLAVGAAGATAATTEQAADGVNIVRSPIAPARAAENPAAQLWHTVRDRAIEAHFAGLLASYRPDLLHVQHLQGMSATLLRQAVEAGVSRRVLTLHDFWFFCANSQLRRPDNVPCAGPSAGCRNCV